MSTLISGSLSVSKTPKDKLIEGKTGKFLPITAALNNEVDQYGNNASFWVTQTKEEREAKEPKVYLGNGKVVWTDGANVDPAPRQDNAPKKAAPVLTQQEDDLPF